MPRPRRQPRIGITVHVGQAPARSGELVWRFQVSARYAEAVVRAGGVPLLLPTHPHASAELGAVLDSVDGLLLSGGGSLPGQYFVDNPEPTLRETNVERYDLEVELAKQAWARGLPLMGICRGHQTIAEAFGGYLINDLGAVPGARNHYQDVPAATATHGVSIERGSRLAEWLGSEAKVNSFHRQVVDQVPRGWRATAVSDDGWIEAMEAESGFGLGVQFHPEALMDGDARFLRFFEEFVLASAGATHAA